MMQCYSKEESDQSNLRLLFRYISPFGYWLIIKQKIDICRANKYNARAVKKKYINALNPRNFDFKENYFENNWFRTRETIKTFTASSSLFTAKPFVNL